jgi:molecular chaperone DnaJ
MKNYYKILEVEENASEDDIKKSYRSLSKKYHPDINPGGDDKFKEIVEAYGVLSDKQKRIEYDFFRKNTNQGPNLNDIFSNFFGQQQRQRNTVDKVVRLTITPIDSYKSEEKLIQYNRDEKCNPCNGTGGEQQVCSTCGGQGFQVKMFGEGFMVQHIRTTCNTCGGRGYTLVHKCNSCDGRGHKLSNNSISIKLPHGIDGGQFIRIAGRGDFINGNYGDLIIQIQVDNRDGFEKMGNDLVYQLFLNYDQLMLDKYDIPHPDGNIMISAPKIIDTSKSLRIRGKGYNGGDMYIRTNVRFEKP